MKELIKKFWNRCGRNYLIACFLYLTTGLLFVLVPFTGLDEGVFLIGGLLMASGLLILLLGLTGDKKTDIWPLGPVLIVFGIWMMFCYKFVLSHIYLIMGLAVLVGGLVDLYHYVKIRCTYGEPEILTIFLSVVSVALGIAILFQPFEEIETMLLFSGFVFLGRGALTFLYYRRLQEMN